MNRLFTGFLFFTSFALHAQYIVTTYAGNGTAGFTNGDTTTATFRSPSGICMDKSGNIFIADGGNNCIRKITPSGAVTTYAGSATAGYRDGAAATALFSDPFDVCTDDTGNVYVSDFLNQRIRKINTQGVVTTIAGNGTAGYMDTNALAAEFNYPRGICIDKKGNIYVGDSWNHRIRKISITGRVTTYAGGGNNMGVNSVGAWVDAPDTSARFYTPCGLAIDNNGNIYVADAYNHRIRKIDTARVVTTLCGSGPTGPGNGGYADGSATTAIFNTPTEVFSDSLGELLIGDTFGNRIRKASPVGNVTTIAGTGSPGFVNGNIDSAEFNYTRGVTSIGNKIYVVDYNNNAIRLISGQVWDGIDALNSNENRTVKLYPNPNNGLFTIALENINKPAALEVYNTLGEKIYQAKINTDNTAINLSERSDRFYLYRVLSEGGSLIGEGKVIVQK